MLGLAGNNVEENLRSGAGDIERFLTHGSQNYDTDKTEWPLNQPVSKLEATIQVSGSYEIRLLLFVSKLYIFQQTNIFEIIILNLFHL